MERDHDTEVVEVTQTEAIFSFGYNPSLFGADTASRAYSMCSRVSYSWLTVLRVITELTSNQR